MQRDPMWPQPLFWCKPGHFSVRWLVKIRVGCHFDVWHTVPCKSIHPLWLFVYLYWQYCHMVTNVNQSILDRWAWNSLEGCTKVQARKQKLFGMDMTYWTSSGAIQTHTPYCFPFIFYNEGEWGWTDFWKISKTLMSVCWSVLGKMI